MKDEQNEIKTIRMPKDLVKKIQKIADNSERNFSKQVIFMLKEYIQLKENN